MPIKMKIFLAKSIPKVLKFIWDFLSFKYFFTTKLWHKMILFGDEGVYLIYQNSKGQIVKRLHIAISTDKNKIPPNWVAGSDAGQTIPIFIKNPFCYTF